MRSAKFNRLALPVLLALGLLLVLALLVTVLSLAGSPGAAQAQSGVDYDVDNDGLIEISHLAQLDAMRYDSRGLGSPYAGDRAAYYAAFPRAVAGMGCHNGDCTGYELAADLNFDTNGNGQADAGDAYWNEGAGWLPIGRFSATFDGRGHTISNLFIDDGGGLFGFANGTIRNVGLIAVNVSGEGGNVGGLVGGLYTGGSISNSYATGAVSGRHRVGGLVGGLYGGSISDSYATCAVSGGVRVGGLVGYQYIGDYMRPSSISNSYATGSVSGEGGDVGGLVGDLHLGSISNSYATGAVTGGAKVGGLVGYGGGGSISDSYATGAVTGEGDNVGGLVGWRYGGSISDSYATGAVSGGGEDVGGLVGAINSGSISDSYATGSVTGGGNDVGGLVGGSWGSISNSYATGTVSGAGENVGGLVGHQYRGYRSRVGRISNSYARNRVYGESNVGGLVGHNNTGTIVSSYSTGLVGGSGAIGTIGGLVGHSTGSVSDCYWDTVTSGQSYSDGGTGKTTRELQSPTSNTGIYANWDPEIWNFGTSSQYPYLKDVGPDSPTRPGVRLTAPTNVVATVSGSSVTVTWTDGQGAAGHLVRLYQADLTGEPRQATAAGSSHTFRDVPPGDYIAVVVAFDADANQELATSSVVTVAAASSGLTAPTNVVATVSGSSVTVTWTDGQGAVSHLVFLFRSDFSGDPIIAAGAGGSHTFSDVAPGRYIAVVVAVDASGEYQVGISGLTTVAAANTSAATDRAALVALYNATDGPNWTNNDGWLSDQPIGEWHGVGTGDDGRVIILGLSSNGLTGTLPAELGNLSGLVWLDLDYNGLSGEIPAGLGDLSGLTVLRLGSNELTGPIPAELGRLSNLTILGLGNNQLTGSIPSQLGNLSGLVRFSVWNNQLTGPIPSELGNLSELERLNLSANGLTGGIPSQLGDLNKLTVLELGSNRLTGEIPTQIGQLTNLLRLSLSNNQLTGEIPSALGMLTDLVELHLWENGLNGPIPVELGRLTDLKALNLGDNQLSGNIPVRLADLSSLTHLHLNGNQLVGPVPAQLGSLSQLTRLYLRGNRLSGTIPAEMGGLSNLEVLDLSHNQLTGAIPSDLGNQDSAADTREFDSRLMGMTAVQPDRAFQATEIAYTGIGRQFNANASPQPAGLSALRVLNLSHNRLTGAVPPALGSLTSLKRLYLNNNRLTGALPAAVGGLRLQARHVDKNQQDVDDCGAVSPEKGVENDRKTLQYLYTATDGRGFLSGSSGDPKWRKGEGKDKDKYYYGWEQTFEGKDNFPLGSWYGVTTNRHGRVIKLELGGNGLKDDTADWHENLAELRKDNTTVSSNDPLYCLMELDLSGNKLYGDIGAVLSNLNLAGDLDVRLRGNRFINWIPDDDPESVKVEMGDGYLTDAIEERVNSVEAADVAKVGLKILRYTSGSRVVRAIAKTGGRVGLLGTVLSNETITDALLTLVFEDGEAACKSLLSSVKDGDSICKYGISHWGHCSLLITATDRSQYPADCPSTS